MKVQIKQLVILILVLFLGCGNPSNSGDDDGDTPTLPKEDKTAPSAPANAKGESGDTMIELSWEPNGETDLAGYNLYRSDESFSDVSNMDPVNGSQLLSNTNFTDEGLENGTTSYYRLTAVDENDNESAPSSQVEVTPFSDPPNRP